MDRISDPFRVQSRFTVFGSTLGCWILGVGCWIFGSEQPWDLGQDLQDLKVSIPIFQNSNPIQSDSLQRAQGSRAATQSSDPFNARGAKGAKDANADPNSRVLAKDAKTQRSFRWAGRRADVEVGARGRGSTSRSDGRL